MKFLVSWHARGNSSWSHAEVEHEPLVLKRSVRYVENVWLKGFLVSYDHVIPKKKPGEEKTLVEIWTDSVRALAGVPEHAHATVIVKPLSERQDLE